MLIVSVTEMIFSEDITVDFVTLDFALGGHGSHADHAGSANG